MQAISQVKGGWPQGTAAECIMPWHSQYPDMSLVMMAWQLASLKASRGPLGLQLAV